MNIQAINNQTSFKAVFSQKGVNFSKPQKRVIDDIKNKTNPNEDFFVENGAKKDSVILSKIEYFTLKDKGKDSKDKVWERYLYIGTYDDNHLFQTEDLKKIENQKRKDKTVEYICKGLILAAVAFSILLGLNKTTKAKEVLPTSKERILNPIKDSLQKVGKNTLDLTKQLMK